MASGKLSERKAGRPGHRVQEAGRGPESYSYCKADREPGGEADRRTARETDQKPEGNSVGQANGEPGCAADRPDSGAR